MGVFAAALVLMLLLSPAFGEPAVSAPPSPASRAVVPRDPHGWGPYLWRQDPDFYIDKLESADVPMPDWRNRPAPRDSRSLHGVFAPDPVGTLRVAGLENATSPCIGDPATPLCAVETYLACIWRRDDRLCKQAWGPYWKGPIWAQVKEGPGADVYQLYRVMRVYEASPGTQTFWSYDLPVTFWREGDVVLELLLMRCRRGDPECQSSVEPTLFTLRRQPGGTWAIVSRDFYPQDRGRGLGSAKDDPDFFTWHPESSVPVPDWRNRPKPRDSRTLEGAFAPDPVGVLRMIQVDGASTSRCIGDPVTALCAVETGFAALKRDDDDLRKRAWGPLFSGPLINNPSSSRSPSERFYLYRVLSVEKVTKPDHDPGWRPRSPLKAGDLIIRILYLDCFSPTETWCSSSVRPRSYAVRRFGPERWHLIDSYYPRW